MKRASQKRLSLLITFFMAFSMLAGLGNGRVVKAEEVAAELIISEYVEGSGSNKAIEIYNGTGKSVNLKDYKLYNHVNGATSTNPKNELQLEDKELESGKTYVLVHDSAVDALRNKSDFVVPSTNFVMGFNGNDVIVLKKGDQVVDAFGQIGNKNNFAVDHTYIRKPEITRGDTNPSDNFDMTKEWIEKSKDNFDDLGKHTMNPGGAVKVVPVTGVKVEPTSLEIEVNKSANLIATVEPSNATNKNVAWKSSNESVATVANGVVTGKTAGEADVSVVSEDGKKEAACKVAVKEAKPGAETTIGDARKLPVGTVVTVKGIVTRANGASLYFQDETGALNYFDTTFKAAEGDLIQLAGKVADRYGVLQIQEATVKKVLGSGKAVPEAQEVTMDKVDESVESKLIIIKNVVLGKTEKGYTSISDEKGNKINIYKMPQKVEAKEGDKVNVIALGSEFKGKPQLVVAKAADIMKIEAPDTEKPVITHDSAKEGNANQDLVISATVTDNRKLDSVKLYFRTKGDAEYKSVDMTANGDVHSATILKENLSSKGLEYYIKAVDSSKNEATSPGDTSKPYQVVIRDVDNVGPEISGLTPGPGVDGVDPKPMIQAQYSDKSGVDVLSVKMYLDGDDVTSKAQISNASASYVPEQNLKTGMHNVKIEVQDKLKNKAVAEWGFIVGGAGFKHYYGQLHAHTAEGSDGTGTFQEAYQWARDNGNADFFALTDHSNKFDNDTACNLLDGTKSGAWKKVHNVADSFNQNGKFVAMAGYEMTWSGSTGGWGHMNTFNTPGFETRTNKDMNLQKYYETISKVPESLSQLNHPGKTFGDFADFGFYSKAADNVVKLVEVGNGEGKVRGTGYFPSYEYYTRALDKGWHLAPSNNQDNHKGNWITANDARTVVIAKELSRDGVYEAIRSMRAYSSEDKNLKVDYTVNGKPMGSFLGSPDKLHFKVNASDPDFSDKISKISIVSNGGSIVASKSFDGGNASWEFDMDPQNSYYYVRIDEADKDIAVTAPVWTGENVPVGISKVSVSQDTVVNKQTVTIGATVFNNSEKSLDNVKVEFFLDSIRTESKIGEKVLNNVSKEAEAQLQYVADRMGQHKIYARATMVIDGKQRTFTESTALDVISADEAVKVIIDGGHQNQYASGNYANKMESLKGMLKHKKVITCFNNDELVANDLEYAKLLVLTDPQSKDDSKYNLKKSNYTPEEIKVIKDFAAQGGSVIVTSRADYDDKRVSDPQYQQAKQANAVLEAIGSNLRMNDDEVVDNTTNNGQAFSLSFNKFASEKYKLADNVDDKMVYTFYSGCSVILKNGGDDSKVDHVVMGHDTTETMDSDKQKDATPVEKGKVCVLAAEELAGGGKVIVAGSTFFSDMEVKEGEDSANKVVMKNILNWTMPEKPVQLVKIKDFRVDADKDGVPDLMGKKFAVEGTVTAASPKASVNNSFFDVMYVQDETGGITVFGLSEKAIPLGTKVRVTGIVDQYEGDTEIQIENENTDIQVLDESQAPVAPKKMSTGDSMKEENEGWLTEVQGKVVRMDSKNLYVDDGSGEARIFVEGYIGNGQKDDQCMGKWDQFIKVGDVVKAVGLASEDSEGHRLRARNTAEIVKIDNSGESGGNTSNGGNANNGGITGNNENSAGGSSSQDEGSLPKTGSRIDTRVLVAAGIVATAVGAFFVFGRKKKK